MKTNITLVETEEGYLAIFKIGSMGYAAKIEIETILPEGISDEDVYEYLLNDYLDRVD